MPMPLPSRSGRRAANRPHHACRFGNRRPVFGDEQAGHSVNLIPRPWQQARPGVQGIDAGVTSCTATLSGTWNGAAVHWGGHVDLTSNPFVVQQIAG